MSSESRLPLLVTCVGSMIIAGLAFHNLQNTGVLRGGTVPAVKTAWLFTVLFYWYVLPLLWCFDSTLSKHIRIAFGIALLNMVLRAIFELPMMYITLNWLHAYGIGHDIFSAALSLILFFWLYLKADKNSATWPRIYFAYSALLFMVEAIFAAYLRKVTGADGSVFFLSTQSSHTLMLLATALFVFITWIVIAMLTLRLRARART